MSDWTSVVHLSITDAFLTEIPDWSLHANLSTLDVSGNYIDFSDGSTSAVNAAAMETAGITVNRDPQQSLISVTLTSSSTDPQTYEDVTLTAEISAPHYSG